MKFIEKIFSIKNRDKHKILTFLGLSLKFRRNPINLIKHINKKKLSNEIKKNNSFGINTEPRSPQITISLTSFPQRMKDIHFCLYSLLNQSFKPDKIILWLSQEEFPDKEQDIPQTVLSLKEKGLEIKWCKNNLKSYKKLIPTLNEFNDCIIVTADDDIFYPPNWLETLYCSYVKNPEYIHCHRAHKILFDINDNILPYNMWEHETDNKNASFNTFFTGAGGVLYPPDSLYKDLLNEELFTQLAPSADDIWFWAMAVLNNTKIKVVENNIKCLTYINPERELGLTNEYNLHSQNCDEGMNDKQLANVFKHYPKVLEKLHNE